MVTISWEGLGVILVAISMLGGLGLFIVRLVITNEFVKSVEKLNGKYVREKLCQERHNGFADMHNQRLDAIAYKLGEIADKAQIIIARNTMNNMEDHKK